jgi:hypothetical protein
LIVLLSLAGKQPIGINARHHKHLQNNIGWRHNAGFVINPCLKRKFQGVGQELAAMFSIQVFANLAETFGHARLMPMVQVVPHFRLKPCLDRSKIVPSPSRPRSSHFRSKEKAGMVEHPKVSNHAGLFANEPPGQAGLPFIQSSDEIQLDFSGVEYQRRTGSIAPLIVPITT